MGTLVGHVAPGFGFFALGLWHLLNHLKLHALNPNYYTSMPWFPTSKKRYLELYLIMVGCSMSISISMELFIGPARPGTNPLIQMAPSPPTTSTTLNTPPYPSPSSFTRYLQLFLTSLPLTSPSMSSPY